MHWKRHMRHGRQVSVKDIDILENGPSAANKTPIAGLSFTPSLSAARAAADSNKKMCFIKNSEVIDFYTILSSEHFNSYHKARLQDPI